ncbi:MAG: phosphoenolpyruvate synthase [Rhodocyclaceae bacterium]|nr:phosphoenolpyruvate synthase [Rhodocyclaceae bacterium]
MTRYAVAFDHLRMTDVGDVGGKNASLGEMISQLSQTDVRVPGGFATTADAFREFLAHQGLNDRINAALDALDVDDVDSLLKVGAQIRQWVVATPFPAALEAEIKREYDALIAVSGERASFAVRSSATAEDLPDASFAGQQESFLNIHGYDNILHAVKEVFASLYNDRAIAYRVHKGFAHADVALSAGVQRMVRSDSGASGVLALGKPSVIRRNLGSKLIKMIFTESRVAGKSTETVDVPELERHKFSLTDADVLELARYAVIIENHYQRPMDIEWGKDGVDGKLYILQARPETVKSQQAEHAKSGGGNVLEKYKLKQHGKVLTSGRAIGQKIGAGPVRIVKDPSEMNKVQPGDVLVADMTDPNWEPVMKRASAIVTNRGGRTCHAAIIARELGIPAIVGCGNATSSLVEGESVTISCAEGDTGYVYRDALEFEVTRQEMGNLPPLPVKIMMNVGNPELAFEFAQIPNGGVGLARLEFVINNMIGIHPKAILEMDQLPASMRAEIKRRSRGYASPVDFFVEKLTEGVATIAAAFYPEPVIVRLSDFKSNEYRKLIGGEIYEPEEENPMLGFRGASRYVAQSFRDCFELECRAMKRVRNDMGLTNVQIMVPFVRTVEEARGVVELLAAHGLKRGENELKLIMMCEIPSNALLAEAFLEHFDGFSIGSNDLTQLTLGLDRDSGLVAHAFDERDPAVKKLLSMAISTANRLGKYVGICGQGPSDHADFAEWLMDEGIQTISLNPDTVIDTWLRLATHKK